MSTTNYGSSIVSVPNKQFRLKNILNVPLATHSLIFVHKFTRDNNGPITFTAYDYTVKDAQSHKKNIQGPGKSNSSFSNCFVM